MILKIKIVKGKEVREVEVCENTLISDCLEPNNIHIDYLCGKKGICKKCLVRLEGKIPKATKEEERLGDMLEKGYRLACCSRLVGDCTVFVDEKEKDFVTAEVDIDIEKLDVKPLFKNCGLAVDIGTTTLAASLIFDDNKIYTKSIKNPQVKFGADVISRIEKQMAGEKTELALSVRNGINSLIKDLCAEANSTNKEIDFAVITGNTVMLHLLTENDCEPLSKAPFDAKFLAGDVFEAESLGLNFNGKIYLPNCFSAFVGADITTAILASNMMKSEKTSLLVDIGTNGEMALWHKNKLHCCSTAAGPAFEGVGVRCGMHGVSGAIDHVSVKNGEFIVSTIGDETAKGICGSGVVDCIASMLKVSALDETGRIDDECEEYEDRIIEEDDDTLFVFRDGIGIYGKDIRAVQLAKSAICSGLITLIEECNLNYDDIDVLYVAGGFGSFLDIEKAGEIGLIPSELVPKVKVIGNGALTGAQMILLNENLTKTAKVMTKDFSLIDLASSKIFMENYIENMYFE